MRPDLDSNPDNDEVNKQPERGNQKLTPSEAPNNSFETGAGEDAGGFDSPPVETHYLGNKDVAELESLKRESSTGEVQGDVEPDPF